MVVLDEKLIHLLPAPPNYPYALRDRPPSFTSQPRTRVTDLSLPLLSRIAAFTLPVHFREGEFEGAVFWLASDLRLTCKAFYAAAMRVLHAYYLSSYKSSIRPPYTTDPLPVSQPAPIPSYPQVLITPPSSPLPGSLLQPKRETSVLDAYCALRALDDFRRTETTFNPDFTDAYADIFAHAQPRARLMDIVLSRPGVGDMARVYGLDPGRLSIVLVPRHARLVLAVKGGERKTVAEEIIERGQTLESVASALVRRLERSFREGFVT